MRASPDADKLNAWRVTRSEVYGYSGSDLGFAVVEDDASRIHIPNKARYVVDFVHIPKKACRMYRPGANDTSLSWM